MVTDPDMDLNEQIEDLEKKRILSVQFSEEYFGYSQKLALLYYENRNYKGAFMLLRILERNLENPPEWINLHLTAAKLQINQRAYSRSPNEDFFPRLDKADTSKPNFVLQRNAIFKEALRINVENYYSIALDEFYTKAVEFGLETSSEWKNLILTRFPERKEYLPSEIGEELLEEEETETETETEKKEEIPFPEAPRTEELHETKKESVSKKLLKGKKIFVVGEFKNVGCALKKIKKSHGLDGNCFEIHPDYYKAKNATNRIKPYSSAYAAIIAGAMPHATKDSGDYSSIVEKRKREEGYPYTVEARTKSGTVKLTLTSFIEAVERVINHLQAMPEQP